MLTYVLIYNNPSNTLFKSQVRTSLKVLLLELHTQRLTLDLLSHLLNRLIMKRIPNLSQPTSRSSQYHKLTSMLITPLLNRAKQCNNVYVHFMIFHPTHYPHKSPLGKPKRTHNLLIGKLFMNPLSLKMLLAKTLQNLLTKFTYSIHRSPRISLQKTLETNMLPNM